MTPASTAFPWKSPLIATIEIDGYRLRTCEINSRPDICGMLRSVTIRSGTVLSKCDKALTPLSASATSYPSAISNNPKLSRMQGSSSTIRIWGLAPFGMCSPDGGRQNKLHFTTMPCPRSPRLVKTEHNAVCSAPRVGNSRPSLKGRQVAALVADNAASRAQEEARQDDSLEPSLRRRGPELVSLAYTAMGG